MPLAAHMGIWSSVPGLIVMQTVLGYAMYFAIAGFSYFYFFVRRKDHYFPGEASPDPAEMKKAIKLSFWNVFGNACFGTPLHYLVLHGKSKLYYHVSDYGWGWYVASFFLFLLLTETGVYWAHRVLHHPKLYKYLHLYHHEYRKPHPWVSMAFHPVDSFAQALPHYLCAFIFPVHISIYFGFVSFVMMWTYFIHDRVSFVRVGVVNYTAHHTIHHIYNKYNFGQFLTLWDRLGGTYRNPKKETAYKVMV